MRYVENENDVSLNETFTFNTSWWMMELEQLCYLFMVCGNVNEWIRNVWDKTTYARI
jgi:hypothetical protein